ncbi:unnamed protein product [Sphagnum balticum]
MAMNDKHLLTNGSDGRVRVVNPVIGKVLRTLVGHTGRVDSIQYCADVNMFITASQGDKSVRVWRQYGAGYECMLCVSDARITLVNGTIDGLLIIATAFDDPTTMRVWKWDGDDDGAYACKRIVATSELSRCIKVLLSGAHTDILIAHFLGNDTCAYSLRTGELVYRHSEVMPKRYPSYSHVQHVCKICPLPVPFFKPSKNIHTKHVLDPSIAHMCRAQVLVTDDGERLVTGGVHGVSVRRVLDGHTFGTAVWSKDVRSGQRCMYSMRSIPGHAELLVTESGDFRIDLWDVDAGACKRIPK